MPRIKMPRWNKKTDITAADLNAMAEAIERFASWQIDSSTGLQWSESNTARTLSFLGNDGDSIRYIKLSAPLPAGDGATHTGHGKGKLMDHKDGDGDGDAGSLKVPDGAEDVDVYGLLTPGLKKDSVIAAFKLGDSWHYLMTLCTNVNTSG